MASINFPAPRAIAWPGANAETAAPKPRFWRRWLDAYMAAQQHRAEHEIARYLGMRGLKFTDSAEREIEKRFLAPHRFHRD